jgi:hypothetical protein
LLEYLHVLTFFSWIPLALLAAAQRGTRAARVLWTIAGLTLLLCGYILYLDFVWAKTVIAPIRVDLLLLIPLTTVTFTGIGVWGLRRPGALAKIASLLLLVLSVPTLAVFAQGLWRSTKEIVRMNARPALIFEAQFRNPRTFENFFGTLDNAADPRAGHFRAEDANGVATRVIVNDRGHFWLLFKCYTKVECVYSEADLGTTVLPGMFKAKPESGPPRDIVVSAWTPDRLTLSFSPSGSQTFARAPVSFSESSAPPAAVIYHGAFADTRVERDYVELVQVWLWQSGDRWIGYYTRRNAQCGSMNDFMFASAFVGRPLGGQVQFVNARDDGRIERFQIARPALGADEIAGNIFYNGRLLRPMTLTKRAVLRAPVYESAPLVSMDVTADWLRTVSMGSSLSWKAECP